MRTLIRSFLFEAVAAPTAAVGWHPPAVGGMAAVLALAGGATGCSPSAEPSQESSPDAGTASTNDASSADVSANGSESRSSTDAQPRGSDAAGVPTDAEARGSDGPAGSRDAASGSTEHDGAADAAPGEAPVNAGPCDLYQGAGTPCVAAHSTVRALYGSYAGNLYQVRRTSDKTTKEVPVLAPGGFVNASVQDAFCSGTSCTISVIYDQSPQHNDLKASPPAFWLPNGGMEADATSGKISVGGHKAYGVSVTGNFNSTGVAYRNNSTSGLAKGDQAEAMYMVLDGTRHSAFCCFDYGNAETDGKDDGPATMEALYWGNSTQFTGGGAGAGPWVAADLENGLFYGGGDPSKPTASNMSVTASFVTAMLKGPSGNQMGLKAANSQAGRLSTMWNGSRPAGYTPMKKQGAIILGTGGDASHAGTGTFFEGAITSGDPPDAADDAVQANVVAAGYGK